MRRHSLLTKITSVAICFGALIAGPMPVMAGNKSVIKDVQLNKSNTFQGLVLNKQGQPIDGAVVTLKYQGVAIAAAKSNARGQYSIGNVRPGAHELSVGAMVRPVRIWKNGTAPKGALNGLVMAGDETVIRGQEIYADEYCETCPSPGVGTSGFGILDVITLATLGGAVTGAIVAFDNQNEIDDLQAAINQGFQQPVNPGSP